MRLRFKKWAHPLVDAHKDIALDENDLDHLPSFDYLEIGSGLGEFAIQMALKNPDVNYLAVEVCFNAFAASIKKFLNYQVENNIKINNLSFINIPAEKLFPLIKDGQLKKIFLNFNDPWPKKKHHKRRLTYPTRLAQYYRMLSKGGEVLYKSDNDEYYMDSKKYFIQFGQFDVTFIDDYKELSEDDVMSEYEQKFRKLGQKIHKIIAIKENDL